MIKYTTLFVLTLFILDARAADLTLSYTILDTIKCNGDCNAMAYLTPSGGTAPYSYIWSVNGSTYFTDTVRNLCAGNYDVTVSDHLGNSATTIVIISQPTAINLFVYTSVTATCRGGKASAEIIISGGTPGYTYKWNNSKSTDTISGLTSYETYYVTVTDAGGCSKRDSVYINPPDLEITFPTSGNSCPAPCCNGFINTYISGQYDSSASFEYSWTETDSSIISHGSSLNGLCPGLYTVSITDNNGCTASNTITIGQFPAINVSTKVDSNNIYLTVSGGNPPYTYYWNNMDTTRNLTNVKPGTYSVTITDVNGCCAIDTINVWPNSVNNLPSSDFNGFTVMPNPNHGSFDVELNGTVTNGTIEIFNTLGQKVYAQKITAAVRNQEIAIDDLSAGVYFVSISSGREVQTKKLEISN